MNLLTLPDDQLIRVVSEHIPAVSDLPPAVIRARLSVRFTDPIWQWQALRTGQQQTFVEDTVSMPSGVHVLLGGNRSGKTETGAYVFARCCRVTLAPIARARRLRGQSTTVFMVGESYEMIGEVQWKSKLKRLIPRQFVESMSWHSKAKEHPSAIRLKNGVEIIARSAEQGRSSFQGYDIFLAWVDEQLVEDVYTELRTRCLDHNAPIIHTLTPLAPDPYLQTKYEDPPDGWRFYQIDLEDNRRSRGGHLDDLEVDRQLDEWAQLGPDILETKKSGRFAGMSGLVYPMFRTSGEGSQVIDDDYADAWLDRVRTQALFFEGWDFGVTNPTVVVAGFWDRKSDTIVVFNEHYQANATIEHHYERAVAIAERHGIIRLQQAYVDSGDLVATSKGDEFKRSARQYLRSQGHPVVNAQKNVARGIEAVRNRLISPALIGSGGVIVRGRPRLLIARRCRNLIREMLTYQMDSNSSGKRDPNDARILKLGDHAPDALRYLVIGVDQAFATSRDRPSGVGAKRQFPAATSVEEQFGMNKNNPRN